MTNAALLKKMFIFILVLSALSSAMAVVYTKHQNRKSFAELQRLLSKRDEMNVYWGKLQLEQGAWTTHGRVEKIASRRLAMESPSNIQIIVVTQ
ncbi:MAG: cell division protein FtsL [Thiohalomonadales bacterium]